MDEDNRLYQVDLTLTSDNNKDLQVLTELIRQETQASTAWHSLGQLLHKMGQFDKTEEVYQALLDRVTDESTKVPIHNQLAAIEDGRGEYQEAIKLYEKTLEIYKQTLPPNHIDLGSSYNNIGGVCRYMGEYSKAVSNYEKALEIQQQSIPPNHPSLGGSCKYIMTTLKHVLVIKRAVEIAQSSLPTNYPDLRDYKNPLELLEKKVVMAICFFKEK